MSGSGSDWGRRTTSGAEFCSRARSEPMGSGSGRCLRDKVGGSRLCEGISEEGGLDAIVFTSTAEVEGLLKSLKEFGLDWRMVKKRCPGLIVACHGPVTADGAERLGVRVDLVSGKFDSFEGVVNSLYFELKSN